MVQKDLDSKVAHYYGIFIIIQNFSFSIFNVFLFELCTYYTIFFVIFIMISTIWNQKGHIVLSIFQTHANEILQSFFS